MCGGGESYIRDTFGIHMYYYIQRLLFAIRFLFVEPLQNVGRERQRIENTCERRKRERIGERKDGEHCLFLSTKKYIMKYRLLDSLFDAERDADAKQSKTRR